MIKLLTQNHLATISDLPKTGRHIVAQYDDNSVVVYQAYRPAIGNFAASHGYFGGEFQLNRMSWIKTNFLWMMYCSGWGTKEGQEVVLAVWLKRNAFDQILAAAVHSSYAPGIYASQRDWEKAVKNSQVRLQWDPDHYPSGAKLQRRAIQLGLRGEFLTTYAGDWILAIEDISEFVLEQRQNIRSDCQDLIVPVEKVYPVLNCDIAQKLQLSTSL